MFSVLPPSVEPVTLFHHCFSVLLVSAAHQYHLSQATKSYAQQQWLSVLVWTKMRPHHVDRFRQVAFHSHQNSKYFRAVLTAAMKLSAPGHGTMISGRRWGDMSRLCPYLPNVWLMQPFAVAARLESTPRPPRGAQTPEIPDLLLKVVSGTRKFYTLSVTIIPVEQQACLKYFFPLSFAISQRPL